MIWLFFNEVNNKKQYTLIIDHVSRQRIKKVGHGNCWDEIDDQLFQDFNSLNIPKRSICCGRNYDNFIIKKYLTKIREHLHFRFISTFALNFLATQKSNNTDFDARASNDETPEYYINTFYNQLNFLCPC